MSAYVGPTALKALSRRYIVGIVPIGAILPHHLMDSRLRKLSNVRFILYLGTFHFGLPKRIWHSSKSSALVRPPSAYQVLAS
jgi:hypothetical protein